MYTFIKFDGDLHKLAEKFRKIFNIGETNPTAPIKEQLGYSLNIGGGEYYCLEIFDIEILLVKNQGEVKIGRMSKYPYYIWLRDIAGKQPLSNGEYKNKIEKITELLKNEGIEAIADDKLV